MRLPDEKELEAAAVEPRVHLQLDRSGRRSRPADRPERATHLESRASGPARVILSVVEQQQRVAAELEEAAPLRVGDAEERRERGVHHLRDLLRSRPARLERRSDIAVKPEMSMKATVPSTSRHDAAGSSRSHSSVSRGTNGTRSVGAGESALAGVAAIAGILLYRRSAAKGGCLRDLRRVGYRITSRSCAAR